MRPVVFGASPLMSAALGVFRGQELGRQRVRDEEDRTEELAKRERGTEFDMLSLAHRRMTNETATTAQQRDAAQQARADRDAMELRTSEVNADGQFGKINDPADKDTDYRGILVKRRKVAATAKQLMAAGHPADIAWPAAEKDQSAADLQEQASKRKREREEHEAKIGRVKAQTAADWARARNGGSTSNPLLDRQINDQEQVASAATRAVPVKRDWMAQIVDGKPINAEAAAAFTADSTAKARTADTEQTRLGALKSVRGDPDVMRRGGYGGEVPAPVADANAQAMAGELQALAEKAQQIFTSPRATPEQKARARDALSREQAAVVRKYGGTR